MQPGYFLLSFRYMTVEMPSWRRLLRQAACWALALARARAGNSIAARIAMIAITTRSSIKVKAARRRGLAASGNVALISLFRLFTNLLWATRRCISSARCEGRKSAEILKLKTFRQEH